MISACNFKRIYNSDYYCKKLQFDCNRKNLIVSFQTSKGNFEVQLNAENYPVTSSNFIENINKKLYKNKKFYKIVNYPQAKIIHAGVYTKDYFLEKNKNLNKNSPTIPLEIKMVNEVDPKYNYEIEDPSEFKNIKSFFEKGSIAMVKTGAKNSSSTEFFFVTNKIPELDGRYSIFGKIVKGLDVLGKIDNKDFIYDIKITN